MFNHLNFNPRFYTIAIPIVSITLWDCMNSWNLSKYISNNAATVMRKSLEGCDNWGNHMWPPMGRFINAKSFRSLSTKQSTEARAEQSTEVVAEQSAEVTAEQSTEVVVVQSAEVTAEQSKRYAQALNMPYALYRHP